MEPFIEFENLERTGQGQYILTFSYKDGDGDLGLNNFGLDVLPPYNSFFYVTGLKDNPCFYTDTLNSPSIPSDRISSDSIVKYIFNPHGNNVILSIMKKNGDDYSIAPYGSSFNCGVLDTIFHPDLRFPRLGDKINNEPIDGLISINVNLELAAILDTDTFLLEFYIKDRALHQSNTVRSTTTFY